MVAIDTSFNLWDQNAKPLGSPDDCLKAYEVDRLAGAFHDPAQAEEDAAKLRSFGDIATAHNIHGAGQGKLLLPMLSVIRAEALRLGIRGTIAELTAKVWPWPERQTTGDCVSQQVRNSCDIVRACEIDLGGELEAWIVRTATEPIYGHRGHRGQGANCGRLANYVNEVGGMMLRQKYPELGLDFSVYNASIGIRWGGSGVPAKVRQRGQQHQIKEVGRLTDLDQVRDAMAKGFGCGGCSGYGFRGYRDANGVSDRGKGWAHAMAWTAFDDRRETHRKYGGPLVLVQNSWGKWNSGPRKIWGTDLLIPFGSFWISYKHARGMLSSGGFYVFSRADGWDAPNLRDWGTVGLI